MRPLTLTVGSAAGALALMTSASPALSAPEPQSLPRALTSQRVVWTTCADTGGIPAPFRDRFECGTFSAPMDWANPKAAARVTVAVSRLKARRPKARGTVFTNPGGPGGPGLAMPWQLAAQLTATDGRSRLADTMDLVGIDVRGTGESTNVNCDPVPSSQTLNARDHGRANVAAMLAVTRRTAAACANGFGALGEHVTTWQTVRDLDLLRSLLGQRKIHWVGFSGGTWLGAQYATAFPQRVGQFVLDSNAEFTTTWQNVFLRQSLGFERRFRQDFTPWAARYDAVYRLGTTGEQVRRVYETVRARLVAEPLVTPQGTIYAEDLDGAITGSLYGKANFPPLAAGLSELRDATEAKPKAGAAAEAAQSILKLRDLPTPMRPAADGPNGTFVAIVCNDTPHYGSERDLVKRTKADARRYPLSGPYRIYDVCQYWKRPAVKLPVPTGRGVPPVLMVQSVHDPATPYEGALAAHRRFAGSRMLTVTDEGDHAIYGGNPCVNAVVDGFLIDRAVPRRDLTCRGMPLPKPDEPAQR